MSVFYAVKNAEGEYTLAYLLRPSSNPPADAIFLSEVPDPRAADQASSGVQS